MLQKNKNNKKVALSLICSRRSFLLCQMKSITYMEIYPGMFYIQSSVPLGKGHLLVVSPFPQCPVPAGGDAEGALLSCTAQSTRCSPRGRAAPRHPPQIRQNPPSPPAPFPGTSHDLFTTTLVVFLPLSRSLWRTGPFPAPLRELECKYLLLGTLCRGLLFTAIELHW